MAKAEISVQKTLLLKAVQFCNGAPGDLTQIFLTQIPCSEASSVLPSIIAPFWKRKIETLQMTLCHSF